MRLACSVWISGMMMLLVASCGHRIRTSPPPGPIDTAMTDVTMGHGLLLAGTDLMIVELSYDSKLIGGGLEIGVDGGIASIGGNSLTIRESRTDTRIAMATPRGGPKKLYVTHAGRVHSIELSSGDDRLQLVRFDRTSSGEFELRHWSW